MNYFTSGIYGNKDLYFELKKIMIRPSDTLWILGDVLDGNKDKPWECLEILEDIERSPNVRLVLGDHEYFHTMRILSSDNEESASAWEDSLSCLDISGLPLLEHMKNNMSEDEVFNYAHFMSQCEVSEMIKIGDRFFYLCHGSPTLRAKTAGGDMAWQYGVVTNACDFKASYNAEITSDNRIREFEKRYNGIDFSKCFVITGHDLICDLENRGINTTDGLVYKNKKFCINQGYTADNPNDGPYRVLGIDAAGFFIQSI